MTTEVGWITWVYLAKVSNRWKDIQTHTRTGPSVLELMMEICNMSKLYLRKFARSTLGGYTITLPRQALLVLILYIPIRMLVGFTPLSLLPKPKSRYTSKSIFYRESKQMTQPSGSAKQTWSISPSPHHRTPSPCRPHASKEQCTGLYPAKQKSDFFHPGMSGRAAERGLLLGLCYFSWKP